MNPVQIIGLTMIIMGGFMCICILVWKKQDEKLLLQWRSDLKPRTFAWLAMPDDAGEIQVIIVDRHATGDYIVKTQADKILFAQLENLYPLE